MENTQTKSSLRGGEPQQIGSLVDNVYSSLKVQAALNKLQRSYQPGGYIAFCDQWDWLPIMQILQSHGILSPDKKRPPIAELGRLIDACNFVSLEGMDTDFDVRLIRMVNQHVKGQKYPWTDVTAPEVTPLLPRWRALHKRFEQILLDLNL